MDNELKAIIIVAIIFFSGLGLIAWAVSSYSCHSKWRKSGFQTDYGLVQGCLISKDGKIWIPSENYRELP